MPYLRRGQPIFEPSDLSLGERDTVCEHGLHMVWWRRLRSFLDFQLLASLGQAGCALPECCASLVGCKAGQVGQAELQPSGEWLWRRERLEQSIVQNHGPLVVQAKDPAFWAAG